MHGNSASRPPRGSVNVFPMPDPGEHPPAALVLAAGASSRFGTPKQLLELRGETLLDRACRIALEAACSPVLRVLGAHADEIASRAAPAGVATVVHADWQRGIGSSLAAGLRGLLGFSDPAAVFILLPDQPRIEPALLWRMRNELARPGVSIVLCGDGEMSGPPALFAPEHFRELMDLDGDRGAKKIAARHPERVAILDAPDRLMDIDTPDAWARFLAGESDAT